MHGAGRVYADTTTSYLLNTDLSQSFLLPPRQGACTRRNSLCDLQPFVSLESEAGAAVLLAARQPTAQRRLTTIQEESPFVRHFQPLRDETCQWCHGDSTSSATARALFPTVRSRAPPCANPDCGRGRLPDGRARGGNVLLRCCKSFHVGKMDPPSPNVRCGFAGGCDGSRLTPDIPLTLTLAYTLTLTLAYQDAAPNVRLYGGVRASNVTSVFILGVPEHSLFTFPPSFDTFAASPPLFSVKYDRFALTWNTLKTHTKHGIRIYARCGM